jgi:hypothetical protein
MSHPLVLGLAVLAWAAPAAADLADVWTSTSRTGGGRRSWSWLVVKYFGEMAPAVLRKARAESTTP